MVIVIASIILSIAVLQGIVMALMIRRQKKKRNLQEIDFRIFFKPNSRYTKPMINTGKAI